MAATRIKIPQLTSGVDGELITWDSSGNPTTVAVGTTGHVLTSNGVGAAPTFQATTSPITASNGLTLSSNNIVLGGSLTGNTTITTTSSYILNVATSRAGANNAGFIVTNNSTGSALKGVASGTGTGYGVWGTSTDNYGVRGESTGIAAGAFFTIDTNSNVLNGLIVDRQFTGGSPSNGIGTSIEFRNETSTTSSTLSNSLISKWTNATHAARVSEFSIDGVDNTVQATLFTLAGSGKTTLNKYGVGTFTGTAAYTLQVDSSGNVIEGSTSGGSGDINNGGNTTGADINIGTNDPFGLNLETNGTTRISMTNAGVINIGQGAAQRVTLSSTASSTSGGIELSSTSTTSGTDVGVKVTGASFTTTPTDNKVMQVTSSYTRSSGGGLVTNLAINPTINFTSTSTASSVGIDITPTLTSMANGKFYGLYMNFNSASAYGLYQSGSSTLNVLNGKLAVGSSTDPTSALTVTGNSSISGQHNAGDFAITDGAGFNVDWNNGNTQYITVAANRTPTFSNPKNGAAYRLRIIQGSGGSKLITWPTVTWRGGTAPTLTTTAGKQDIIVFVYSNGTYFGDASLNY